MFINLFTVYVLSTMTKCLANPPPQKKPHVTILDQRQLKESRRECGPATLCNSSRLPVKATSTQ